MLNEQEKNSLNFLYPSSEDKQKAEIQSFGHSDELEKKDIVDVKKSMNVFKTLAPILIHVLENQGTGEDFQNMLNKAHNIAEQICYQWKIDPKIKNNKWIVNVITKNIAPFLKYNDISSNLVQELSNYLLKHQQDDSVQENLNDIDEHIIPLLYFGGMSKIVECQYHYDFGRKNKENDLEKIHQFIQEYAQNAVQELCPSLTPHKERVFYYSIIVEQLFDLMVMSWNVNAMKAKNSLSKLTVEQKKQWLTANPQGFQLDPVLDEFKRNYNRLIRLTLSYKKK